MTINVCTKGLEYVKAKSARYSAKNTKNLNVLQRFKRNDTCVLIGSGPSVDKSEELPVALETFDSFGCNHIWRNELLSNHKFNYYALVDREYTKSNFFEIKRNVNTESFCFGLKNATLLPLVDIFKNTSCIFNNAPFDVEYVDKRSVSSHTIYTGNVMPFMIQIAMLLGYKRVLLFGVDHYKLSGQKTLINNYFKGYQSPEKYRPVTESRIAELNVFHKWLEAQSSFYNCKIYNLTPGTELFAYDRLSRLSDIPQ